ncbi:MAG TPA: SIS domain-containing protein [Candidatus Saccharimonadales bacterium]|nr:SIS domain-containing protein [Candidatus Saccharimonadales bacterium]
MQPRLQRYKKFIDTQFIDSLLWNKDYSLYGLDKNLRTKIEAGQFKNIIFTGMGCSAIVSDVIKGFFANQQISLHVEVLNDYQFGFLVDKETLTDEKTLIIISSYSGYSQEPLNFYQNIKDLTQNVIFLTSGGKLAEIAKNNHVSLIYWKLREPDREYPLFHVPQYFSILLDIFAELKMIKSNYYKELEESVAFLKNYFTEERIKLSELIAGKLRDREIIFLANPMWYFTLLKLADMHFNEMSMAPAHRNFFHEFTHSEVAVFTNPKNKLAIVIFRDAEEDEYTNEKIDNLVSILTDKNTAQNKNIELIEIHLNQANFFEKFFSSLLFTNYIAYFLGIYNKTESRELISLSAGNPWYNQKTIQSEK